ncbi:MAG: hypothetical protein WCC66_05385 [Rhizobiaceae bacterium]
MVQSFLFFALGFLAAAFLAIAVTPAIWQRAVILTRKRIEASTPLTRNELQADKDQQRAEFAMELRKVEMRAKARGEKLTQAQIDIVQLDTEKAALSVELGKTELKLSDREQSIVSLKAELAKEIENAATLRATRDELTKIVESSAKLIHDNEVEINSLKTESDSRRIEIASLASELEMQIAHAANLNGTIAAAEQDLRSAANQLRAAKEEIRHDKRRIGDAEKKIERLSAQAADRAERLERREEEIERLKEQIKVLTSERNDLDRKHASAERQRTHLQSQNAAISSRLATIGGVDAAAQADFSVLRETIRDIAARIVVSTAVDEGAESPIPAILLQAEKIAPAKKTGQELPPSLAERIRALEQVARRG